MTDKELEKLMAAADAAWAAAYAAAYAAAEAADLKEKEQQS